MKKWLISVFMIGAIFSAVPIVSGQVPPPSNYRFYHPITGSPLAPFQDTIFLVPGQYFNLQYAFKEIHDWKKIIQFVLTANYSGFACTPGVAQPDDYYWFHWQSSSLWSSPQGYCYGGNYCCQYGTDNSSFGWSSTYTQLKGAYLGLFEGIACGLNIGQTYKFTLNLEITESGPGGYGNIYHKTLTQYFKIVDGVRGDANGDSQVTEEDQLILIDGINGGLTNLWQNYAGNYSATGLNYYRCHMLRTYPTLMDACYQNVWVWDPFEPLVQGLGIGELLSLDSCSVADCILANLFGKSTPSSKEAKLSKLINDWLVSVYPNPFVDKISIHAPPGKIEIFDATGRQVKSDMIGEGDLLIATGDFKPGLYIIKYSNKFGLTVGRKIVK
ncbi:MAG: T9SS type A sorting domain-containing protein [Candidatus Falkowbacteria bacterium]|nr:T9SS type A sorting domain-containing protein [Candidatus Falkowbacteria bacterium]